MRRFEEVGAEDCLFAYRMVVVQLLREVSPPQAMQLWEMSWAGEDLRQLPFSKEPPPWPMASQLLGTEQRQAQHPDTAAAQAPRRAAGDWCPSLLQCFIVEAIRSQQQAICNKCTNHDAILALFSTLPPLNFGSLMSSALQLRRRFLPKPAFEDLPTFDISA